MNVSADRDRTGDGLDVGFFHEYTPDTFAQCLHVMLRQVLAVHEFLYPVVWY